MKRQYVSVKFKAWDKRSYTYHNEAEPVNVGDKVEVPTRDGLQTVEVVGVTFATPGFATKPIIRKAPPPPVAQERLSLEDIDEEAQSLWERDRE